MNLSDASLDQSPGEGIVRLRVDGLNNLGGGDGVRGFLLLEQFFCELVSLRKSMQIWSLGLTGDLSK